MPTHFSQQSVILLTPPIKIRKLNHVPFVELADGRLQGVVSSGSDISRVYVSFIDRTTHDYYCSTNNNRPCGGLRGGPCKHIQRLLDEALLQYGAERVLKYLRLTVSADSVKSCGDLLPLLNGDKVKAPAATVFSRFLNHLAFLEYDGTTEALPEMDWFVAEKDLP